MRKLGKKNTILFVIICFLSISIIVLFLFGSSYVSKQDKSTHDISSGSIIYDYDLKGYEANSTSKLKKSYDGNYYLTTSNKTIDKYKIGKNAVVYNNALSTIYLYGTFYQILENGEVEVIKEYAEIDRNKGPYFYKIDDRKYLWIDDSFTSNDKSIKTKNYLIIELDKMGNATFVNHEISSKTINPVILAGSKYSFNIAEEKLIIGNEKIDLKNIIGSTNQYENKNNESEEDNYYDEYFKTIVSRFNNLNGSLEKVNEKTNKNNNQTKIELTKWVKLSTIENGVTSIKINYNVFDPNNEYESIFIIVNNRKIYLNKDNNNYILRNLLPNTEYTISFGHTLLDENNNMEIIDDVVKIRTLKPSYVLTIEKITTNKIYFYLKSDDSYVIESGKIKLYSDNIEIFSKGIDVSNIQNGYTDYFEYENLGYEIEIKIEDAIFNGEKVILNISSKYINK